ncbi:HNH endonuclease signature motif containing protein [Paraburkholderia fungorum]|uniref:HNH endonuclease n=1 Tax=Paraburkholderia fungorum TaxID=134537 RepID=UPI0038BB9A1B
MEVLLRADGTCEGCGQSAPFQRADGTPYLEVHHRRRLADGGEDTVENAIALCPNCHRERHCGINYASDATSESARLPCGNCQCYPTAVRERCSAKRAEKTCSVWMSVGEGRLTEAPDSYGAVRGCNGRSSKHSNGMMPLNQMARASGRKSAPLS